MIYGEPTMCKAINNMIQEATWCHDQSRDIEDQNLATATAIACESL